MTLARPHHRRRRRNRPLVVALFVNAALLLAILAVLVSRREGSWPSVLPSAFAGPAIGQPIAGGGTVYLMPGQMSMNTWGCYVMDTDRQTLSVYQFFPGEKQLRFVAARNFSHDLRMKNFNTTPDPLEIRDLNARAENPRRGERAEDVRDEVDAPADDAGGEQGGEEAGEMTVTPVDPESEPAEQVQ
jgi:hypothetical protein